MSLVPKAAKYVAKEFKDAFKKGKKTKEAFDKTPVGNAKKKSDPYRYRYKAYEDTVKRINEPGDDDESTPQNPLNTFHADYGDQHAANASPPTTNPFAGDFDDGHAANASDSGAFSEGSDGGIADMGFGDIGSDTGGGSGSGFGVPVLLDLDGDGIEIVPLGQSRARFDIDGDGRRQLLAWVGPDDGLLVYDRDGDRLISQRDEIAFIDYLANAKTYLEGLAWFDQFAQGGNEDGVLDARDALWSKFGVWRDADQDGETDAGELRMTDQGGLSSVDLQSDGVAQQAGPDVRIHGKGRFEVRDDQGRRHDGDLYDASLRYAHAPREKTVAEILYDHPTSRPQPRRLRRKDGQPMTGPEKLFPSHFADDDYVMGFPPK